MGFLKKVSKFFAVYIFMYSVLILSVSVAADTLSPEDSQAMEQTIQMLNDRMQRQQVINNNPQAQKVNEMAQKLMGEGTDLDQMYKVAGEIFRNVASDNGGDAKGMMQKMMKAQENPEAFFNTLSPEQRKMIEGLSQKVQQRDQRIHDQAAPR